MDNPTIEAGLQVLAAAVTVPDLPVDAAPSSPLSRDAARRLLDQEMAVAGDLGLYAGALPSILAARLAPAEVFALAAALRAVAAYVPEPEPVERRLEAL